MKRRNTPFLVFAVSCFTFAWPLTAQVVIQADYSRNFAEYHVNGSFVLTTPSANRIIEYNPEIAQTGYLPASTFKIPNSLIALEEGVIKDTNQVIPWDGHKWPHAVWNKDQTLSTALKSSCIWVYFNIAEQVGIPKYQQYLESMNYGNKNIAGPENKFWLAGEFRISAREQVAFLEQFYNYQLPFAAENIDVVKQLLITGQNEQYVISAKTGAGRLSETDYIMWYVGYVEIDHDVHYFALNFISDDFGLAGRARQGITMSILKDSGIIP